MAKKTKISDELREALLRLNEILDEIDMDRYRLSMRQLGLLQEYLAQVVNPVSHRPVKNYIRDAGIAAKVAVRLEINIKPSAAHASVAEELANDRDLHLDERRIGQIYDKYKDDWLAQYLKPSNRNRLSQSGN